MTELPGERRLLDTMVCPSRTRISARTRIRRHRTLPAPGQTLVRPGDRVEATQVVARTRLPHDLRIVPVARVLGVPASDVERKLEIELGSTVQKGDLIAKGAAPFGPRAVSPIDGVMTAIGSGLVLVEAHPLPFELRAHLSGTVVDVQDARTVSIETTGALIEGFWGTGEESTGVVKLLTKQPDAPLRAHSVNPACHGAIIVAGTIVESEPLIRAENVDVRGVVTGGLSPELLPLVAELAFPLVITGAFGETPMMSAIFRLLAENEGRPASISGRTDTQYNKSRPEVIIPLPYGVQAPEEEHGRVALKPGARVRVVRTPYAGRAGTVLDILPHPRPIPTGARVHCASLDLGEDNPILVPLTNLDILV